MQLYGQTFTAEEPNARDLMSWIAIRLSYLPYVLYS